MKSAGDFPKIVSNRITPVKLIKCRISKLFFCLFFQLKASSQDYQIKQAEAEVMKRSNLIEVEVEVHVYYSRVVWRSQE